VAGGCILALCCDQRFIAEGHKLMGLNEVKLGVSIPYPSDCILRDLVGSRISREIVEGGEFYPPEESLRLGMVDRILPLDQVICETIKEVERMGATPAHAFAQIKRDRTDRIEKQALAMQDEKEEAFLDLWFAPETRTQLEKAMEKF
jgi:enoyl-CoA hydratase/carnithine racemase